jgi:hypothetical protein
VKGQLNRPGANVSISLERCSQADEAYGGTQAEGKYTPKDAYDAAEAGMNRGCSRTRSRLGAIGCPRARGAIERPEG